MFKKLFALSIVLLGVFALAACGGDDDVIDEDQVKVDEAAAALLLGGLSSVTQDLTLPVSGRNNTTISWASSNPGAISNAGVVTRPDEDGAIIEVTLTATITLNEASATREFTAYVMPEEASNIYTEISELHANSRLNDLVSVQGVVVSVFQAGYFIYDGENALGIYNVGGPVFNLGDELLVTGTYAVYNTLYQISGDVAAEVLTTGNDYAMPVTPLTIEAFHELDVSDRNIHGQVYRLTGLLVKKGSFDNFFLESTASELDVLFYYLSSAASLEVLEDYVGEVISIDLVFYTEHSRDGFMVTYNKLGEDIEIAELGDEDVFNLDILNVAITPSVTFEKNVTLPTLGDGGTTFTAWSSSHPEVLANDGSFVASPDAITEVTFTGTATLGTLSEEVTVTVKVGAETLTVAETLAIEKGELLFVTGIVVSVDPHSSGYFIQDEDGTAIYIGGHKNVAPGNKVVVAGTRDAYTSWGNAQEQVWNAQLIDNDEGENDIFVFAVDSVEDVINDFPNSVSKRYRVENVTVDRFDTRSHVFFINSDEDVEMQITFDIREVAGGFSADDYPEGTVLAWVEFTTQRIHFYNFRVVDVVFEVLEDE